MTNKIQEANLAMVVSKTYGEDNMPLKRQVVL
jgi:hypothetical protein